MVWLPLRGDGSRHAMPITPPWPGKILEDLRAVEAQMREAAEKSPDEETLRGALVDVQAAIEKLSRVETAA